MVFQKIKKECDFMKKTKLAVCSLIVGAAMLTGFAFADTAIGSGYKKLKNDIKTTAKYMANDVKSYSAEATVELKADGETFIKNSTKIKNDKQNKRYISEEEYFFKGEDGIKTTRYTDSEMIIEKRGNEKQSVVYLQPDSREFYYNSPLISEDPFEDEYAQDVENVIDAFAGSLTDTVQCEESEKNTTYICDLQSSQIPAYINAIGSLVLKQSFSADDMPVPKLKDDIYIESASAKVISDENGRITNLLATGIMSGKDENGNVHKYVCEMYFRLYDMEQTEVKRPEIEPEAQISESVSVTENEYAFGISESCVGKYVRDITETKNGKLEKTGIRELVISKVDFSGDNGVLYGHYKREYTAGEKAGEILEFDFVGETQDNAGGFIFEYNDGEEIQHGCITGDYVGETVYVAFSYEKTQYGGYKTSGNVDMIRVFE